MSQHVQSLRLAWQVQWARLSIAERRLVTAAASLALLVLLVAVCIRPAWRTLQTVPAQLKAAEAELAAMRLQADEAQRLRLQSPVPAVQAEASLQSATERLGAGARLTRQADRSVLNFQGVSGEALAQWLEEARVGARARPIEASWQRGSDGRYQGSVTLALGEAESQ